MALDMMEEFIAAKFAPCCHDGENHIDICITCLCCLGPQGPLSAPLVCTAQTDFTEIMRLSEMPQRAVPRLVAFLCHRVLFRLTIAGSKEIPRHLSSCVGIE